MPAPERGWAPGMAPPAGSSRRGARRPRWLMSFADTMLLLFTFFVLLFSMSVIDNRKYRQMTGALESAFSGAPGPDMDGVPASRQAVSQEFQAVPLGVQVGIEKAIGPEIQAGDVEVEHNAAGLTLRVKGAIAFDPGSVQIREEFKGFLQRLATAVSREDVLMSVEGHTDGQPPRPGVPSSSNWDLSARRAINVVEHLNSRLGIAADRLAVVGHGDGQPLAANDTEEGRARNRRVEFRLRPRPGENVSAGMRGLLDLEEKPGNGKTKGEQR